MSTNDLTRNESFDSEKNSSSRKKLERLNREIYESLNDTIVVGRIHHINERKDFLGRTEKLSFVINRVYNKLNLRTDKIERTNEYIRVIVQEKDLKKYNSLKLDDMVIVIGSHYMFSTDIQVSRIVYCANSRKHQRTDNDIKKYIKIIES